MERNPGLKPSPLRCYEPRYFASRGAEQGTWRRFRVRHHSSLFQCTWFPMSSRFPQSHDAPNERHDEDRTPSTRSRPHLRCVCRPHGSIWSGSIWSDRPALSQGAVSFNSNFEGLRCLCMPLQGLMTSRHFSLPGKLHWRVLAAVRRRHSSSGFPVCSWTVSSADCCACRPETSSSAIG